MDDLILDCKEETENESKLRHLQEEQAWLKDNLAEGCICRVCKQHAKIYRRNFGSAMAIALIAIYRAFHQDRTLEWLHVEDHLKKRSHLPAAIRGDFPKAIHWELLEKPGVRREDGSMRAGLYRITPKGVAFVKGVITIPKWVKLYNTEVVGFAEEHVYIQQALKEKFSYSELMGW